MKRSGDKAVERENGEQSEEGEDECVPRVRRKESEEEEKGEDKGKKEAVTDSERGFVFQSVVRRRWWRERRGRGRGFR